MTRPLLVLCTMLCAALASVGCKGNSGEKAEPSTAAAGASAGDKPAGADSAAKPVASGSPPAGAPQDKAARAAELAGRIMIGVSAAVKGAKGDCAQMGKSVPAVIKAAGRPRSELRALLSEPAVKAEYKAAIEAGKYPALRKDLSDAQSGSVACTDVFNQVDRVVGEII